MYQYFLVQNKAVIVFDIMCISVLITINAHISIVVVITFQKEYAHLCLLSNCVKSVCMYEYYLFTDFYHTTLLPPNLPMCVIHLSTVIVDTSSEEITSKRSSIVLTTSHNSLVLCFVTFCALCFIG